MPTAAARHVHGLALCALATAGFDLAVFVLLHLAQPGVDVVTQPTSAYVHGSLGFFSSLASGAVGLGGLCLAAAAWQVVSAKAARVGAVLLGLFGLAKLAQAFFPIDPAGQASPAGAAHNLLGNVAFFVFPVAAALLTAAVARATGHGRPAWRPALATWLPVAMTVLVLAADALGWFGLAQRLYLLVAMAWTALLAAWLLSASQRGPRASG